MQKHLGKKGILLRIFHGVVTIYLTLCLIYLYLVGFTGSVNGFLFILSVFSLGLEGIAVFSLNKGDCPLIHIQRRIGDNKPFFELLLPPRLAKRAIPAFGVLTVIALLMVMLRYVSL